MMAVSSELSTTPALLQPHTENSVPVNTLTPPGACPRWHLPHCNALCTELFLTFLSHFPVTIQAGAGVCSPGPAQELGHNGY